MNKKDLRVAENAIAKIAIRERKPVSEIKKEMEKAMFVGLCSQDPTVQAYWRQIPCEGDVPTPEELIIFVSNELKHR